MKSNKVLIVAAHPDDEVLMCGALSRKLSNNGVEIKTLILGEGITSRDNYTQEEVDLLHSQVETANKLIGSQLIHLHDFSDNRFDSVDLLDIVKVISKYKNDFVPDTIITHYRNDLNIDHRRTYEAVITATRPMEDECIKNILSGEVLSSTEWQFPHTFSPNIFYDVSDTLESKISAMKVYSSEIRQYPHPRSIEGIINTSKYWGMQIGLKECEVFELIRLIVQ